MRGRCEIAVNSRVRTNGAELVTTMRLDYSATVQAINDLAASINMRATLTPIAAPRDDGGGE